jgi:hypothetical protein
MNLEEISEVASKEGYRQGYLDCLWDIHFLLQDIYRVPILLDDYISYKIQRLITENIMHKIAVYLAERKLFKGYISDFDLQKTNLRKLNL